MKGKEELYDFWLSLASSLSLLPISSYKTFAAIENDDTKNYDWQSTHYQNPGGIFTSLFNLWSWKTKWLAADPEISFVIWKRTDLPAQMMGGRSSAGCLLRNPKLAPSRTPGTTLHPGPLTYPTLMTPSSREPQEIKETQLSAAFAF